MIILDSFMLYNDKSKGSGQNKFQNVLGGVGVFSVEST